MKESDIQKAPEQELIELILKYRDAVNQEEYLPVSQRESDREKLNYIYGRLRSIRQKILDSKCYLELGKLQRQLSNKFLADDTQPEQRIEMLSYLVRCLCYPIVFMAGRNTISPTDDSQSQESVQNIESDIDDDVVEREPKFRSRPISPEEVQKIQMQLHDLLQKYPAPKQWQQHLSIAQAEILSQMSASGDIEITVRGKSKNQADAITSIVLKESEKK